MKNKTQKTNIVQLEVSAKRVSPTSVIITKHKHTNNRCHRKLFKRNVDQIG